MTELKSSLGGGRGDQRCNTRITLYVFVNTKMVHSWTTPDLHQSHITKMESYLAMICEKQKENRMFSCLQVCLHFQLKSSCLSSSWVLGVREVHVMDKTVTSVCLTPSPSSRINTAGGKRLSGPQPRLSASHCLSPSLTPFSFLPLNVSLFSLNRHTQKV